MSIRDGSCPHCFTDLDRGFRGQFCTRCGWASLVPSDPVGNVGRDETVIKIADLYLLKQVANRFLTLVDILEVEVTPDPQVRAMLARLETV